jgi:hypothetical protein
LRKRNLPEQKYNPYQEYDPYAQQLPQEHYNEYAPNPVPQPPHQQQPYQPEYQPQPEYKPEPLKEKVPEHYHGNPKNHITPSTDDRNDYMNIRKYAPIPEDYCMMNNLNVTEVRETEEKIYSVIEKLNERDDYVSPCALINQPKDVIYRPYDPEEKLELEKKVEHVVEEIKGGKAPEPVKQEAPKGEEVKQEQVEEKGSPQRGPPGQESKQQQQGPPPPPNQQQQKGPPNQQQQGPPTQQQAKPQQGPGPAKFYYFAGSPRNN